jgi:hypothetical protein
MANHDQKRLVGSHVIHENLVTQTFQMDLDTS